MSSGEQRVTVLKDNPELSGKKFFLCSMISPEGKQKNKVYGYKIHDMCEDMDEVSYLKKYYHDLDPDFDVFVGTVGKWLPWVFSSDDIPNAEYANEQLNELVKAHRMTKRNEDRQFIERVNRHTQQMEYTASKKAQKEKATEEKESCVQMLYRIKQLELLIVRRQSELNGLMELFEEMYTEEEREDAKTKEFPLTEPPLMYYDSLKSQEEGEQSEVLTENEAGPSSSTLPELPTEEPPRRKTLAEIKAEIIRNQKTL